jgi:hypothetical protein
MARPVILLDGDDPAALTPGRKMLVCLLLLALKDRAREVRLEPGLFRWRPRYEIDGVWHDMMPIPFPVPVIREACRLAHLDWWHRPAALGGYHVRRWLGRSAEIEGELRCRVDAHTFSVRLRVAMPADGRKLRAAPGMILSLPISVSERKPAPLWEELLQALRTAPATA